MNSLKDRIKKIRKDAGLTQESFAQRIGTVQNTITGYETGRRNPSGSALALICSEFSVNKDWLENGIGEPYIQLSKNEIIVKATRLLGKKDPLFEAFVETYSNLDASVREILINTGLDLLENLKNNLKKE